MFLTVGGYLLDACHLPAPSGANHGVPGWCWIPPRLPTEYLNFPHQDLHLGHSQTFAELHRHSIHIYERPQMDPERNKNSYQNCVVPYLIM